MFSNIFGLNPQRSFVGACFSMIGIDQKLDEREIGKIFEVLERYGIKENDFNEEAEYLEKNSTNMKELLRHGQLIMEGLIKLDTTMKNNLIIALTELSQSDNEIHEAEKMYLNMIKNVLGIK